MRLGSLFSGLGGFSYAARHLGWQTQWFAEIEPYPSQLLTENFPGVPNHGSVALLDGRTVAPVDVLTGGFPCQDISLAGKGAGIAEGTRSGLWSHYARLIDELRPRWVVAENVSALRSRGLDRVLGDLLALGYDAQWHCIPASYVGAPHRRDRVWVVAYPHDQSQSAFAEHAKARGLPDSSGRARADAVVADADGVAGHERRSGDAAEEPRGRDADRGRERAVELADAIGARLEGLRARTFSAGAQEPVLASGRGDGHAWDGDWWTTEPDVGRVAHGVPARVERLKALGNSIVPAVAWCLLGAIDDVEKARLLE